jgi:hypothetical protein
MNALLPPGKQNNSNVEAESLSGMTDKKSKYKGDSKCKGKRRSFDFAALR